MLSFSLSLSLSLLLPVLLLLDSAEAYPVDVSAAGNAVAAAAGAEAVAEADFCVVLGAAAAAADSACDNVAAAVPTSDVTFVLCAREKVPYGYSKAKEHQSCAVGGGRRERCLTFNIRSISALCLRSSFLNSKLESAIDDKCPSLCGIRKVATVLSNVSRPLATPVSVVDICL